jgi:hypothetical protein
MAGALALAAACGSSTKPSQPMTTLTGIVSDQTSTAIAGVLVTINGGTQDGLSATTDAAGRFTLSGQFAVGTGIQLHTSGAGFPDNVSTVVPTPRANQADVGEANLREPTLPVIAGMLEDNILRPISNAAVHIVGGVPPDVVRMSDSLGHFLVLGTPAGPLTVSVSKEGFAPFSTPLVASQFEHGFTLLLNPFDLVQLALGAYTVTFTAVSSCTALPPELRSHVTNATVSQSADPLRYLLTFDVPPAVLSTQSGLVASGHDLAYVGGYAEALASDTFYEFSGNEDLTTGSVGSPAPSAVTIPLPFAQITLCQLAPGAAYRSCATSTTVTRAACTGASLTLTRK